MLDEAGLVRWGERIGRSLVGSCFISLIGPLGAGKSVLARSIARGLGVAVPMPSPTFSIFFQYEGTEGRSVAHLDLFRLSGPEELAEVGWDDLGAEGEVILVEWPERAGDRVPASRWEIELEPVRKNRLLRAVSVRKVGDPPRIPGFPLASS